MTINRTRQKAVQWIEANTDRLREFGRWYLYHDGSSVGCLRSPLSLPHRGAACPVSAVIPWNGNHDCYPVNGYLSDDALPPLGRLKREVAAMIERAADGRVGMHDPVRRALMAALEPSPAA